MNELGCHLVDDGPNNAFLDSFIKQSVRQCDEVLAVAPPPRSIFLWSGLNRLLRSSRQHAHGLDAGGDVEEEEGGKPIRDR